MLFNAALLVLWDVIRPALSPTASVVGASFDASRRKSARVLPQTEEEVDNA